MIRELLRTLKRRYAMIGRSLLVAVICFYFVFHLVTGNSGIFSMIQLQAQLESVRAEAEQVKKHKELLQAKVNRLYHSHLDADLLDEQLRHSSAVIGKGEVLVYLPNLRIAD